MAQPNNSSMKMNEEEQLEGFEEGGESWGDYPIDSLLIRHEARTVQDVTRRIGQKRYVMDPEFQRDFIWDEKKQSKLIESVVMRIPLPVFYLAEDEEGRMIVVDGLQRLTTFQRFTENQLTLSLPDRRELHGKKFVDLVPKLQNRIEDCNLIFYIIDSKVPDQARLDIFERVNGGVPLTRQQMRNCLFMGPATRFLKKEAQTETFQKATGRSLSWKRMHDREFVNRFCAFKILGIQQYRGDMDKFLADCLREMNAQEEAELQKLSKQFRNSLSNNYLIFRDDAFRKPRLPQERRKRLNASLWDVMSTGLSSYPRGHVESKATDLNLALERLIQNEEFNVAVTYGPNDARKVRLRFEMAHTMIEEILGAYAD